VGRAFEWRPETLQGRLTADQMRELGRLVAALDNPEPVDFLVV
jgi:hypothetical protein